MTASTDLALKKFRDSITGLSGNADLIEKAAIQLHEDLLPEELVKERLTMQAFILAEFDAEAAKSKLRVEQEERETEVQPD